MKIKHFVVAATTAFLLTTGNAWAGNDHKKPEPSHHVKPSHGHKGGKGHHKVPEINAKNGTSAIALLAGVLLLAAEGFRSRRA